jgi:hypothetical protein
LSKASLLIAAAIRPHGRRDRSGVIHQYASGDPLHCGPDSRHHRRLPFHWRRLPTCDRLSGARGARRRSELRERNATQCSFRFNRADDPQCG